MASLDEKLQLLRDEVVRLRQLNGAHARKRIRSSPRPDVLYIVCITISQPPAGSSRAVRICRTRHDFSRTP